MLDWGRRVTSLKETTAFEEGEGKVEEVECMMRETRHRDKVGVRVMVQGIM